MSGMRDSASGRRDDRWIPWLFVGFFAVVLIANGTLAYLATASFTGLQTDDHYRKGLAYNRVLAAERAQSVLGWSVSVDFTVLGTRDGRLVVRATDRDGMPLEGAAVTARLIRPTQSGYDMEIDLAPAGGGAYTADLELPLRGQWDIRTQIAHRSGTHRAVKRFLMR